MAWPDTIYCIVRRLKLSSGRLPMDIILHSTEVPEDLQEFFEPVPDSANLSSVFSDIKQSNYRGAHFATMPIELATRCVKLGTSDAGCCPTCGAQWAPVVETTPEYEKDNAGWTKRSGSLEQGRGTVGSGTNSATVPPNNVIQSWRLTCQCEHNEGGRPVIIDPFHGSGTTGEAARECGCDYIGVELHEEYIELSKKRFEQRLLI